MGQWMRAQRLARSSFVGTASVALLLAPLTWCSPLRAAPTKVASPEPLNEVTPSLDSELAIESDTEAFEELGPFDESGEKQRERQKPQVSPPASSPEVSTEAEASTEKAAAKSTLPTEPPPEPSLWPFTFGTSTWSRFELRDGYERLGVSRGRFSEGDLVAFRARLAVTTGALPLVGDFVGRVHFAPQASGYWGTSGVGGTVGEANLGIYEGYFSIANPEFEFQAGRFAMNYGDAVVIGDLGWHESGRAFDGVRARHQGKQVFVDAFMTSVAEGWPAMGAPAFAGDTYFWGMYFGLGRYISPTLDLELYLLGRTRATTDGLTDAATGATYDLEGGTLLTQGVRAKLVLGHWDFLTEAGVQTGGTPGAPTDALDLVAEGRETLAYQVLAEVGARPVTSFRVAAGGALASGDDPATTTYEGYDDLYATGHKFLGWTDVIGARLNVLSGYLSFAVSLTKSLEAIAVGHLFGRPSPGGLGRVGPEAFAGTEVDLQLTQRLGKYVALRAAYCWFDANAGHYASGDVAQFFETQAGLTF